MKKYKKLIIIISIIVIIILVGLVIYSLYLTRSPSQPPKEWYDKKGFNIVYTYYTFEEKVVESYLVLDKNNKVLDTKVITTGYSDEELQSAYDIYTLGDIFHPNYNVKIKDKALIYNAVWDNGKTLDQVIAKYNNGTYENLKIQILD